MERYRDRCRDINETPVPRRRAWEIKRWNCWQPGQIRWLSLGSLSFLREMIYLEKRQLLASTSSRRRVCRAHNRAQGFPRRRASFVLDSFCVNATGRFGSCVVKSIREIETTIRLKSGKNNFRLGFTHLLSGSRKILA